MSANTTTRTPASAKEIHIPTLALNREQAAKALNTSPSTVDRLTKRGLLKPSRATRRPLFGIEEINRFLRETTADILAQEVR